MATKNGTEKVKNYLARSTKSRTVNQIAAALGMTDKFVAGTVLRLVQAAQLTRVEDPKLGVWTYSAISPASTTPTTTAENKNEDTEILEAALAAVKANAAAKAAAMPKPKRTAADLLAELQSLIAASSGAVVDDAPKKAKAPVAAAGKRKAKGSRASAAR